MEIISVMVQKATNPGIRIPIRRGKNGQTTNDGTELWEKLVKVSPQLKLVLNGHIMGRHVGYRKDDADGGHEVHQIGMLMPKAWVVGAMKRAMAVMAGLES